jgi:hypothetical protein
VHSIDNIKQATQTYIDNLNREALSALPTSSTAPQRQRTVLPLTSDELLRASIEITVNCDTWTGQLFASLSRNRGVVLERVDLCGTLFVHSKRVSGNERVAWFGYSKLATSKAA